MPFRCEYWLLFTGLILTTIRSDCVTLNIFIFEISLIYWISPKKWGFVFWDTFDSPMYYTGCTLKWTQNRLAHYVTSDMTIITKAAFASENENNMAAGGKDWKFYSRKLNEHANNFNTIQEKLHCGNLRRISQSLKQEVWILDILLNFMEFFSRNSFVREKLQYLW